MHSSHRSNEIRLRTNKTCPPVCGLVRDFLLWGAEGAVAEKIGPDKGFGVLAACAWSHKALRKKQLPPGS